MQFNIIKIKSRLEIRRKSLKGILIQTKLNLAYLILISYINVHIVVK